MMKRRRSLNETEMRTREITYLMFKTKQYSMKAKYHTTVVLSISFSLKKKKSSNLKIKKSPFKQT